MFGRVGGLATGFGLGGALVVRTVLDPEIALWPTLVELAFGLAAGTGVGVLCGRLASRALLSIAPALLPSVAVGAGAGALFVGALAGWWTLQESDLRLALAWGAAALGFWNGLLLASGLGSWTGADVADG